MQFSDFVNRAGRLSKTKQASHGLHVCANCFTSMNWLLIQDCVVDGTDLMKTADWRGSICWDPLIHGISLWGMHTGLSVAIYRYYVITCRYSESTRSIARCPSSDTPHGWFMDVVELSSPGRYPTTTAYIVLLQRRRPRQTFTLRRRWLHVCCLLGGQSPFTMEELKKGKKRFRKKRKEKQSEEKPAEDITDETATDTAAVDGTFHCIETSPSAQLSFFDDALEEVGIFL